MVSFDICGGNPGAMQFLITAYNSEPFLAEAAFQRMLDNQIVGSKLYMLWNDCLNRDTPLALRVAINAPIDMILHHINYEGGRGIPFTPEEMIDVLVPK